MTDTRLSEVEYQNYLFRARTIGEDSLLLSEWSLGGDIIALWQMIAYQGDLIERLVSERDASPAPNPDQ